MSTAHSIPLLQAVNMTTLFRGNKENILADKFKGKDLLPICETFDRAIFDSILSQNGCTSVRIYYGMSTDLKLHAILVGVNSNNEDILPPSTLSSATIVTDGTGVIGEDSQVCPPICPPPSPLHP